MTPECPWCQSQRVCVNSTRHDSRDEQERQPGRGQRGTHLSPSTVNKSDVSPITRSSGQAEKSVLAIAVLVTTKKWAVEGGPSGCCAAMVPSHNGSTGAADHHSLSQRSPS